MTRTFFALLIHSCLVSSLWAHEGNTTLEDLAGYFEPGTLVEGPELVPWILSGGTETTRFEITVLPEPGSAASGLDECGGHEVAGLGYHYHVNEPGANQILGCLRGEAGCALTDDGETCDASRRPGAPRRAPPTARGTGDRAVRGEESAR